MPVRLSTKDRNSSWKAGTSICVMFIMREQESCFVHKFICGLVSCPNEREGAGYSYIYTQDCCRNAKIWELLHQKFGKNMNQSGLDSLQIMLIPGEELLEFPLHFFSNCWYRYTSQCGFYRHTYFIFLINSFSLTRAT